ncbi:sulfate ABC transporter substrate-binding protein [Paenibacillus sp. R14(2021)]|uniref:sulfate ABC transporter substrate-binding protein n=1 Tax=Paenibacillus sp. R14(2021) TaxID=2859228 RepID=UPI002157E876|nr:sulfate ABC transporter substrate-binding protein [Paenibacillus sp. R14(2021)]
MKKRSFLPMHVLMVFIAFAIALTGCGWDSGPNEAANNSGTKAADNGGSKNTGNGNASEPAAANDSASKGPIELLNVSYDPTRELYEAYNKLFADYWKKEHNQDVTIKQSHAGSGAQSRAVIDGLKADVVTLALGYDIDAIAQKGLINPDWQQKFDNNSSPYTSTIVFLVRKGNPKGIKDWNDLVKPGVQVITPNPKTSGGARWNYLAAWGYALKQSNGDEEKAKAFVKALYKNVPVLDSGARGSTTTFVEKGIGDVLLAWENEALLSVKELGKDKFDIVYPSLSILAEPPVAIVDKNVDKKGSREVAEAYLDYLYTESAQKLVAQNFYRPQLASVAEQFADQFPAIEMLNIDDDFGGWAEAQKKHFADGGVFDQLYTPGS